MKNLLTFLFALLAVSSVHAFMGTPVVSARAKVRLFCSMRLLPRLDVSWKSLRSLALLFLLLLEYDNHLLLQIRHHPTELEVW